MIKKIFLITAIAYFFFVIEFILNGVWGGWAKPELLLLLVIFWGLYSGIRYSIWAAIVGGFLKDTFSILPFGTYLFVFVCAAYLTTIIRNTIYQPGSRFSRAVVAFFVLISCFLIQMLLYLSRYDLRIGDMLINIFLPQLVATMVVVTLVFHRLRDIAVWFKI